MGDAVKILTEEPTIEVIAEMVLDWEGVRGMARWVKSHRPECLPEGYDPDRSDCDLEEVPGEMALLPHDGTWTWDELAAYETMYGDHPSGLAFSEEMKATGLGTGIALSSNELLVELAGRKCYDSFGAKAGRKTNAEYIAHTQSGAVPHASIMYHAKMSFFFAGLSRRVSQEIMRNYVGADRDQEGSPSQESSRFTHHYGTFVAHPRLLEPGMEHELKWWEADVAAGYKAYLDYISRQTDAYEREHGKPCAGMARKRIYESAIGRMPWDFETSFIWTTNPVAIAKFCRERCDDASDLEMQRFAKRWRRVCVGRWPNLFPQSWMKRIAS